MPNLLRAGVSATEAEQRLGAAVDAAYGGTLLGDFMLTVVHDDGRCETVTVGEVLGDRVRWNECDTRDPVNPLHRRGSPDCRLYLLGTSPIAYSLDDSGTVYRLRLARQTVITSKGNRSAVVEELARIVVSSDGVFTTDSGPVALTDKKVAALTPELLMNLIGTVAALVVRTPKGDVPQDVTREVASLVLAALR